MYSSLVMYERIFAKITSLIDLDQLREKGHFRFKSHIAMDLNIDLLEDNQESMIISMAHNYIKNGDAMADPDMEIRILPKSKLTEALTFQHDSLGIYQEAYPKGLNNLADMKVKKDLNKFLEIWLKNIHNQKFTLN